jgi:ABC-type xylose transport system substrate-binding protein
MYIVRGEPREGNGAVRVVKWTREDALATAIKFLDEGIQTVTIIADDRTYTAAEFALTLGEDYAPRP